MRTDLARTIRKPHRDQGRMLGQPSRAPVGVLAPAKTGVFAQPVPRAPSLGQRRAARRVARAQRQVNRNVAVAPVPKLAHPSAAQRQAARDIAIRSLGGQGIRTRQDVQRLSPLDRRRANRLLGYVGTQQKYVNATVAANAGVKARAVRELAAAGAGIVRRQQVAAATTRGDRRVGVPLLASIGVPKINVDAVRRGIIGATSLGNQGAESTFTRNALSDALSLGSAPLIGGIQLEQGATEAAKGLPIVGGTVRRAGGLPVLGPLVGPGKGTGRLTRLGKGVFEGLKQDAAVKLLTGHPNQAVEQFRAHPGFAALDLAAGVGAAGRVGGALARGAGSSVAEGGVRGALARVGQEVRSPLALTDDAAGARGGLVHERQGSRSLAGKGLQSVADQFRKPLVDSSGTIVTVRRGGRDIPVLRTSSRKLTVGGHEIRGSQRERLLKRGADFGASRAQSVENLHRTLASHEFRARGVRGAAKELVSMVVEGTITSAKHFESDVRAERDRIQAHLDRPDGERVYRHTGERRAAQHRLKVLNDALASPKLLGRAEHIVSTGEDIGRALNAKEAEAIRLGILDGKRARRSRLVVPAIAHGGARHYAPEEVQALLGHERSVAGVEKAVKVSRSAHDAARAAITKARRELDQARAQVKVRAGQRRQAVAPLQRSLGATRGERVARFMDLAEKHPRLRQMAEAEARDAKLLAARTAAVKAAVNGERAARKARRDAEAAAAMLPPGITQKALKHGALRHGDGRFLSNRDIEALLHAKGRDPATVAYLPHRMDVRGARAFHTQFRPGARPQVDKPGTRTGSAYTKGVTEASHDLIVEQGTRLATQTAKARELDRFISEHGMKHPSGRFFTGKEAKEYADRLAHDTGEELVPVAAFPAKASKQARDAAQAENGSKAMEGLHLGLLNDRLKAAERKGAKNVVLVPAATVKRLEDHLAPAGDVMRVLQFANRAFRNAVLPQPRWLTGNFVEPFLVRLPVAGSGLTNLPGMVLDVRAANRILKRMESSPDPKLRHAAAQVRAQQMGGLFVGRRGASVRRTAEDLPGILKAGAVVRQLPVVKQVADLTGLLLKGSFAINRVIEQAAQKAALGRLARHEIQAFTGSWLATVKIGERAAEEAARGLVGTPTQARLMRAQHELLGKYEGFSPTMRRVVQGPAPFLPWSLASARFVFWTMPLKHPVVTDLLVKAQQVNSDQWDAAHAGVPPGSLKSAIVQPDGGLVDVGRYTPYGFSQPLVEGEYASLADTVLPQVSGTLKALQGLDPFGRPLQVPKDAAHPDGSPDRGQKAGIALNAGLEAAVPYLAVARRLREGGGTAYSNSNVVKPKVKPGTSRMSAVQRTFDPFRPTYLKAGAAGSKASAGGGLDPADLHDVRQAAHEAGVGAGLDKADLEELRAAVRGG